MGIRSVLAKPFAAYIAKETKEWSFKPVQFQQKVFNHLIEGGKGTLVGKDHGFESIRTHEDFKKQVPIRDYEDLKPYVEKILHGESDKLFNCSFHDHMCNYLRFNCFILVLNVLFLILSKPAARFCRPPVTASADSINWVSNRATAS